MDFSLSEEQSLLKDSISKYLTKDYDFQERRKLAASEHGFGASHWANFAELGWLSVPFEEEMGGYGGQIEDVAVVFETFAKALVLEPFLACVMLSGKLLARAGEAKAVGSIIDGSQQWALAALERQSGQNFHDVLSTATSTAGGFILNGTKVLVMNGGAANSFVISARTSGAQLDRAGVSLFVVEADSVGLHRTAIPLMDGSRTATIVLDNVELPGSAVLGELDEGYPALEAVIQEARIAVCAEAVGIIDTLCDKTVEYSKTRTQFGVSIGSFQALQHRMVDMLMAAQQSRSILYRAICEFQQRDDSAAATIAAMKALVGKHGRHVGEEAIQLHGGMGMTDELDIGHFVKRLMVLNQLFGNADTSLREFCAFTYPSGSGEATASAVS
jgi:alkylation response protein AidB-like acyl-CoA dehydrogenase